MTSSQVIGRHKFLIGSLLLIPLGFCCVCLAANFVTQSPDYRCSPNRQIYKEIEANRDEWLLHFHANPTQGLSISGYEVRYDHPAVSNDIFVVDSAHDPGRSLGKNGYIYAVAGLIPQVSSPYEVQHISGNMYCYWR